MKKSSLQSIVNYLNGETVTNLDEIKAEIEVELAKGANKAQANRELYAEYRQKVLEAMRSANVPVTAQDLAKETGIARGKIVYGLTNYWTEDVVAEKSGKTTVYTLA